MAFTAAQIPDIAGRRYPKELAGPGYPKGIPIYPEERLAELIRKLEVQRCVLAYSDLSYQQVMRKAAVVEAAGADFWLLGPAATMLKSARKVIAVTAVRTGCGKSQTTRFIARLLKARGVPVVAVRHPMPYGDLRKQEVQRFASAADLTKHKTTIEEREEYEPLIEMGVPVYAGVDYGKILRRAEREVGPRGVIIFDGGNNDFPFYKPDIHIVIADPLRAGHEVSYYPGEVNVRMADIAIINKEASASQKHIEEVRQNIRAANQRVTIIDADSTVRAEGELRGKRVLVIEDGPTLTHGGMAFGAGTVAAKQAGAVIVDPRPFLQGELKAVYARFPHLGTVVPAMGYTARELRELEQLIARVPCDVVVAGTPIDLRRVIRVKKPVVRIRYELAARGPQLERAVAALLRKRRR